MNIQLISGYVFDDQNGESLTLDKINRMFEDGFGNIISPITIAQGGTGASTAAQARINLGAVGLADLANTSDPLLGDNLVGYKNTCDTTTVGRTVHDKLDEYLSITDFGAVGDGATDNTVAIQNALDNPTCDKIFIPAASASYQFAGPLTVNSDTYIFGEGRDLSILENTDAVGANAFEFTGTGSDVETGTPKSDLILKDFTLKGNSASGHGLSGNIAERVIIENVFFDTHGLDAINIGADNAVATANKVRDIFILRCESTAGVNSFRINGGSNILIAQSRLLEYTTQAIIIEDCFSVRIIGNRGESAGGATTTVIQVRNSVANNANGRPIRGVNIRQNVWEEVRTGQDFIGITPTGTTETCAGTAIENEVINTVADYDFIELSGICKSFRIDSNVIQSDSATGAVGINIGALCEDTVIGSANCFENGENIVDAGIGTIRGGGGNYILVSEVVVSVATDTVDFTGLDIDTDKFYRMDFVIFNPTTLGNFSIQVNGFSATYNKQELLVDGVTATAARAGNSIFATLGIVANSEFAGYIEVRHTVDDLFSAICFTQEDIGRSSGALPRFRQIVTERTASVANITQLTIKSSAAGSIGIGSTIRLYKITS